MLNVWMSRRSVEDGDHCIVVMREEINICWSLTNSGLLLIIVLLCEVNAGCVHVLVHPCVMAAL